MVLSMLSFKSWARFLFWGLSIFVFTTDLFPQVSAFKINWPKIERPLGKSSPQPITKSVKKPVLTVLDPRTQARIHLVGVSHGSPSSASLVKEMFEVVDPRAVVVELCDDRFLSISLDSKIRPRENATFESLYDRKIEILERRERELNSQGLTAADHGRVAFLSQLSSTFRFIQSQGLFGGIFVMLGLMVSSLQRLSRSSTTGDEFVTAMQEAEKYSIPVRLGDAPQNDTLNSIKGLISADAFNPTKIVQGAKLLTFSALGFPADTSFPELAEKIPPAVLEKSEWVSIPGAYVENTQMLKSLAPVLAIVAASSSIGFIPFDGQSTANAVALLDDPLAVAAGGPQSWISLLLSLFTSELPPWLEFTFSSAIDVMALLLLIRMAKVIGTDRDCIIAKKVQEVADEFPGQDIVVVIGMLHCNGVARWLLSGTDPLKFTAAVEGASNTKSSSA